MDVTSLSSVLSVKACCVGLVEAELEVDELKRHPLIAPWLRLSARVNILVV